MIPKPRFFREPRGLLTRDELESDRGEWPRSLRTETGILSRDSDTEKQDRGAGSVSPE